ncbi:exosortase family protein XrtG [Oscillospiraceae bacterium HV4-5-C5C]|nr:exosortase family protein XrtG [Oscillospiraceae bacterium HV4-5-C5C]
MSLYLIIGLAVWLYLLSVLKRAKLPAVYFIVGSVGWFFILMYLANPYWIWVMKQLVTRGVGALGSLLGWSETYASYSMLSVFHGSGNVTILVDYECSGIIESTAFWALMVFFPVYARTEKLFYCLTGFIWIYISNVIRLFIVVTLVHLGGVQWFFWAHSIIGRMVFYVLVMMLYYTVFTYSQISRSFYEQYLNLWRRKKRV